MNKSVKRLTSVCQTVHKSVAGHAVGQHVTTLHPTWTSSLHTPALSPILSFRCALTTCVRNFCSKPLSCKPLTRTSLSMINLSKPLRSYTVPKFLQCSHPVVSVTSYYSTRTQKFQNPSSILESQSALHVKRPTRKKAPKMSEGQTIQINNVVAYAVGEQIDLQGLEQSILKQGLYNIGDLPHDLTNALHVSGKYNVDQKPKEIFVFEDGSVVFWCVPEVERGAFLKVLTKYAESPYVSSLVFYEREEMDFTSIDSGRTGLSGDIIQLRDFGSETGQPLLELYSFSNALAQSVKLAIWEASLNKFVTSIEKVTEDLRHGRKISMSRRQVLMKTGELFSLRHLINLSSDLLDTPDFYWDREGLEPLYLSLCHHLNMSRRTRVMNEKLNHCCELTELLSSQLNDAHHTRLEVMIIVLILVEVVFEIIHYAERYLDHPVKDSSGYK